MGFIVHLRVDADTLVTAKVLAVELVDAIHRFRPEFDVAATTVSHENLQGARSYILCGEWIDGRPRFRCVRLNGHNGLCSPVWPS